MSRVRAPSPALEAEYDRVRRRTAEYGGERRRTAENGGERRRTAENGRERQRTAENGRERQRTAENGGERRRTAVYHTPLFMRFLSFLFVLGLAAPLAAQYAHLAPGIAHYNARRWAEGHAFFASVTKA